MRAHFLICDSGHETNNHVPQKYSIVLQKEVGCPAESFIQVDKYVTVNHMHSVQLEQHGKNYTPSHCELIILLYYTILGSYIWQIYEISFTFS